MFPAQKPVLKRMVTWGNQLLGNPYRELDNHLFGNAARGVYFFISFFARILKTLINS